ncbi:hypothetical protein LS684_09645 [Cytobacillus spongiae]|uniref:hypothetical protein n=1 Tax=Cytobacillus spongiae TaxID=2901381 RepID=UPI001F31A2FB|nr:hypothetical protein [Cytobacillus spongiae]UII57658.1 hypothetical protein LS684_09645 [Cytobacillus spongiae]
MILSTQSIDILVLEEVLTIFTRKIIAASISGAIFAVLLGLVVPNPFGEEISSVSDYFWGFLHTTPMYLVYSFPVILVYGVLTSMLSDAISGFLTRKAENPPIEPYLSLLFHLLFGIVLWFYSLSAAFLFFVTDRLLRRREESYTIMHAVKSLIFPFAVWFSTLGFLWAVDLIKDLLGVTNNG